MNYSLGNILKCVVATPSAAPNALTLNGEPLTLNGEILTID